MHINLLWPFVPFHGAIVLWWIVLIARCQRSIRVNSSFLRFSLFSPWPPPLFLSVPTSNNLGRKNLDRSMRLCRRTININKNPSTHIWLGPYYRSWANHLVTEVLIATDTGGPSQLRVTAGMKCYVFATWFVRRVLAMSSLKMVAAWQELAIWNVMYSQHGHQEQQKSQLW